MVYAKVKQFSSMTKLSECVLKECSNFDPKYMKRKHVESMTKRMVECLAQINCLAANFATKLFFIIILVVVKSRHPYNYESA